ncbi:MAG: lipocalin-like domain-containing protein [Prevotellaceae bacterium]|nr:lipocalin-like domain-containing protein [Prevotellaceae bacterium]
MAYKKIVNVLVLIAATAMIAACDIHTSDNGDLDGFWQMQRLERLNNCSQDINPTPMYWSFECDMMEVRPNDKTQRGVFFRFDHSRDSLKIHTPLRDKRSQGDIPITDAKELYEYGIFHLSENFVVEQLSSETMVLSSDSIRAYFRKY